MRSYLPAILSAALIASLLVACGGGGSSSSASSGTAGSASGGGGSTSGGSGSGSGSATGSTQPGNPGTNLTSLTQAFAALPHTDAASDANALLAAAKALPDVQSAGLSNDYTVWVEYKDGTGQIIVTQPRDDPDDAVAPSNFSGPQEVASEKEATLRAKDATRPDGRNAFVYNALTKDFTDLQISNPTTMIAGFLQSQNYNVTTSTSAGYNALREVQNASLLYLDSHGGVGVVRDTDTNLDTRVYGIATPTPVSDSSVTENSALILSGEMGYISVAEWFETLVGSKELRLASYLFITPKFVLNHMTFTSNSMVFINGCGMLAGSTEADDMVAAFHTKGAAHVLGWTDLVSAEMAADSGVFLFDRLLGTDGYPAYPGNPANRPFNLPEVMADMRTKLRQSKAQHGSATPLTLTQSSIYLTIRADLKLDSKPMAPTLALAPTISSVSVRNDSDSLTLYGDFGSPAQIPVVTIGGHQLDAISSSGQITVTGLPRSGDGSGGAIKVTVDGASSNSVMLNQWNNIPVVMTTYNGNWVRTVTCAVNLRGVFDTLRSAPDRAPDANGVSTDETVVQNGSCSFVSVNPSLSGALPWWNFNDQPTRPLTGVQGNGLPNNDGHGGGTVAFSLQAFYDDGHINFLDSSAAAGSQSFTVDPVTQALAAGSVTQSAGGGQVLDTLVWSATSPQFSPAANRSR